MVIVKLSIDDQSLSITVSRDLIEEWDGIVYGWLVDPDTDWTTKIGTDQKQYIIAAVPEWKIQKIIQACITVLRKDIENSIPTSKN